MEDAQEPMESGDSSAETQEDSPEFTMEQIQQIQESIEESQAIPTGNTEALQELFDQEKIIQEDIPKPASSRIRPGMHSRSESKRLTPEEQRKLMEKRTDTNFSNEEVKNTVSRDTFRREMLKMRENIMCVLVILTALVLLSLGGKVYQTIANPMELEKYVELFTQCMAAVLAVILSYQYPKQHGESVKKQTASLKKTIHNTLFGQKDD